MPALAPNRVRLAPLPHDARAEDDSTAAAAEPEPAAAAAPTKLRASEYPYASTFAVSRRRTGWRRILPAGIDSPADLVNNARAWFAAVSRFWTVKVAQVLCVTYIVVLTFSSSPLGLVDPASGFIIDPTNATATAAGLLGDRPVVASNHLQMACLAVSRMSAFSLYPVMILVFLSKCKATINFLEGTRLTLYMWHDMHALHIYCGHYIAFDVWVHTLFHLIRWGTAGNISLLWTHPTGVSGLVVVLATPLITLPMLYMKTTLPYEVRKALHYLFYVFAVGMCFHVPASGVPNGGFLPYVLGACIVIYFLDAMYIEMFMTEKIETTTFHVLPSGVQMTMAVSSRFQSRFEKGGYAYVCLPWVSRNQWHAFSLFEDPVDSNRRQVFMQKSGDWSSAVHSALQRNTVRPIIVQGPFCSPYQSAMLYDNQVLVASGIGITPALSVIRAHKTSRRVNLIWAVRDPAMLEFFLERFELDNHAWNLIFYTGKEPINPALEELQTNVRIIKQRPNLFSVIPNIIYGIESKKGLPEEYLSPEPPNMMLLKADLAEMASDPHQSQRDKLRNLHRISQKHGYSFTEVCRQLEAAPLSPMASARGAKLDAPLSESEHGSPVAQQSKTAEPQRESEQETGIQARVLPGTSLAPVQEGVSSESSVAGVVGSVKWRPAPDRDPSHELVTRLQSATNALLSGFSMRRAPAELTRSPSVYSRIFGEANAQSDREVQRYILKLDRSVINTWGILYCGGSQPVQDALTSISSKYKINLSCESFAW